MNEGIRSDGERSEPTGAVLVSAPEVRELLNRSRSCVLLDVRWALGVTDGREQYLREHLPGAIYVDLETELAAPPSPETGRHPLPSLDALESAARRWGVDNDSVVVAYDAVGNLSAARVWWLLRWGGLENVRLLDGGIDAWRRAGFSLADAEVAPRPGNVTLRPGRLPVLDADSAAALVENGVLLDARAPERFRGELEPVDPTPGHIPGAVSAPTTENLRADGTFESPETLASRFRALGVDRRRPVGVYCGSGVTASHEVAALAIAGIPAALYSGSWSQWCSDPERPVATGE